MNIVVLDDEPVIGNGIAKMAENFCIDWHVINIFTDAQEALELCNWDDAQVLLADINMPHMDGLEMLDILQKRGYEIPTIFITAYASFEYARSAVHQQALDYLLKPLSRGDLHTALQKAQDYWDKRITYENGTAYITKNLWQLRCHFLSDLVFEERYFSLEQIKDNAIRYHLNNKRFTLMTAYLPEGGHMLKERLKDRFPHEANDELDWFFYGNANTLCVILAVTDKGTPDIFIETVEQECLVSSIQNGIEDINNLSELYRKLLFELRQELNSNDIKDAEILLDPLTNCEYSVAISQAVNYIHQNYYKKLSLKTISEQVYLHPTYLSNIFKKQTGYNIVDYINYYRVRQAQKMLQDPNNKIYWIMERVGFVNERYFCEVFKKITGMTPTQYRQVSFLAQKH